MGACGAGVWGRRAFREGQCGAGFRLPEGISTESWNPLLLTAADFDSALGESRFDSQLEHMYNRGV